MMKTLIFVFFLFLFCLLNLDIVTSSKINEERKRGKHQKRVTVLHYVSERYEHMNVEHMNVEYMNVEHMNTALMHMNTALELLRCMAVHIIWQIRS